MTPRNVAALGEQWSLTEVGAGHWEAPWIEENLEDPQGRVDVWWSPSVYSAASLCTPGPLPKSISSQVQYS